MRTASADGVSGQHLLALAAEETLSADELFDEAQEAEEAEDWARAPAAYQKAHAIRAFRSGDVFNLSHALLKLGEWQEAPPLPDQGFAARPDLCRGLV